MFSYLAFGFYVFVHFWHICKKIKNKDFRGVIVLKLWSFVFKNFDKETIAANKKWLSILYSLVRAQS